MTFLVISISINNGTLYRDIVVQTEYPYNMISVSGRKNMKNISDQKS